LPSDPGFRTLSGLHSAAERALPASIRAYVDGGAGEERTLRANRRAFEDRRLFPRALVNVERIETRTHFLGEEQGVPFFIAPTAYQALVHPEGESGMARAAAAEGVLYTASTMSNQSMELVAKAASGAPRWFQLYVQPDPARTSSLVERARAAGYRALVLTVDAPILGDRDRQEEAGFTLDPAMPLGNLDPGSYAEGKDPLPQKSYARGRITADFVWESLERLCRSAGLPVLVKGVISPEDARRALASGARGVVVSNHGGRQLDGAPATLEALPGVVQAVGDRGEVYLDGGVRRGADILVALALGARGVGLGRPSLWALAAGGEAGVRRWLALLREDLRTALALTGCRAIPEIRRDILFPG
jgi:4-hydroxymandelate oxidase